MKTVISFLTGIVYASQFLFSSAKDFRDYCVIGAGPGGLQIGYYLERAGRDYIIFERDRTAGWFFKKYPRLRNLISINKRYTGKTNKEFNLRHDWNSLLSDDESLLYKHYSKAFFPSADSMVKYLKDYATKLKLKVQYNTNIRQITNFTRENETMYELKDQNGQFYQCRWLIMSTGLWVEAKPRNVTGMEYTEGYPSMSMNPDDYEGQTVLVIGRGNSAFETANNLLSAANYIHMMSRERVRFSWETHYVGDVRAINSGPIDTYQLKSLDGQFEGNFKDLTIKKRPDGKLVLDSLEGPDNSAVREPYDRVLRCLGFKFDRSIFNKTIRPKPAVVKGRKLIKYPKITPAYESTQSTGVFFTGTATHSLDWRASAGGFIHGFRYTARALHRLLEWRNHKVEYPHVILSISDMMNHVVRRFNEASGSYQMFNALVDVVSLRDDGKFEYFEELPKGLLPEFEKHTGRPFKRGIIVNLEYGKNFSYPGSDPFRDERATGSPSEAHTSNFLHPVLYYYDKPIEAMEKDGNLPRPVRVHHTVEDFLAVWDALLHHHLPLRWFMEQSIGTDIRNFYADSCFEASMTMSEIPLNCQQDYLTGSPLPRPFPTAESLVPKAESDSDSSSGMEEKSG